MKPAEKIGLSDHWFAKHHPAYRKAIKIAFQIHFLDTVEQIFEQNKSCKIDSSPQSWAAFNTMRDPRNVDRVVDGTNGITLDFLLGVAAKLKVDVARLIPDLSEWIALATVHLITSVNRNIYNFPNLKDVELFREIVDFRAPDLVEKARLYTEFILGLSFSESDFEDKMKSKCDSAELQATLDRLPKTQSTKILEIARLIGEIVLTNRK
ncbi:MAG: hypothetical protein R3B84_14880 [Zavarzinella sp.]